MDECLGYSSDSITFLVHVGSKSIWYADCDHRIHGLPVSRSDDVHTQRVVAFGVDSIIVKRIANTLHGHALQIP